MPDLISIKTANYLNDYKIAFKFNDGKENIVDFGRFITHSQHPDIQKYQDLNLFQKFQLKDGELDWNDYELVFPIFDLYQGHIC